MDPDFSVMPYDIVDGRDERAGNVPRYSERLVMHESVLPVAETLASAVLTGLSATPKRLAPAVLYDALGSALFEAICELPEYDLTRNESAILFENVDEMLMSAAGGHELYVVELGSGSARKSRVVLERLLDRQRAVDYHAIDVSRAALIGTARTLLAELDGVRVHAHVADYANELVHGDLRGSGRALVMFLGSNVGNYEGADARALLRLAALAFRADDALLLGTDLRKAPAELRTAYDDPTGVTRAFVLNALGRINRELSGTFDLRAFRHGVAYDDARGCVDAYLESICEQRVAIAALRREFAFTAGERIHVESSRKFTLEQIEELTESSGWRLERTWTDERSRFAVSLLRRRSEVPTQA